MKTFVHVVKEDGFLNDRGSIDSIWFSRKSADDRTAELNKRDGWYDLQTLRGPWYVYNVETSDEPGKS